MCFDVGRTRNVGDGGFVCHSHAWQVLKMSGGKNESARVAEQHVCGMSRTITELSTNNFPASELVLTVTLKYQYCRIHGVSIAQTLVEKYVARNVEDI